MNSHWLALSFGLLVIGLGLLFVGWTSRACTLVECPESAKHAPRLVVRGLEIGFSDGCNVCTLDTPAFLLGAVSLLAGVGTVGHEAVSRHG